MAGALANMGGCAPSPNVEPPLIKCSSVNEAFLRCFLTDDKVLKHFNGENDGSGSIDSYSGCGRPHNAHSTAKINNRVKDVALTF